jgi:diguanylate cyclase (GGDEF)-like protein
LADDRALVDLVDRDHALNGAVPTAPPAAMAAVGAASGREGELDEATSGLVGVLTALMVAALGASLALAAVLAVARDLASAVSLLVSVAYATLLSFVARPLAMQGRLRAAVLVACGGLLATTLALGFVVPAAVGIGIVLPLVAVAVALPFVDRRTLLGVMVAAWLAILAIAIMGELSGAHDTALAVSAVVRVAAVGVAAALIMLLLWQFSARLVDALGRMATANLALRSAEEQVGQVNEELRHRVDELESRNREMSQLARLGDLLQSCETSEEAYAVIAQTAGPLFAGDSGVLYELTGNRNTVEQVAAWGDNSSSATVFRPSECWALRRGRVYLVEDTGTELLCAHVGDVVPPGYLCVPLTAQSETLGMLHIEIGHKVPRSRRLAHLAERQRLAVTLAEHLALALANFRLRATLQERSTRDELTGLFNRRFMEDSLEREVRRAIRDSEPLGVVMLDLDHFKRLNDAFGHAAGDFALRLIGQYLQSAIRAEDIACRFGGEEFVIILPKAGLEDTRRRAETIRIGIQTIHADPGGPTFPTMTMSMGVAGYPEHGATGEALLRAADEALYRAKASGRDRVVVAGTRERGAVKIVDQSA